MPLNKEQLKKFNDFYISEGYFFCEQPSSSLRKLCKKAAKLSKILINNDEINNKTWKSVDGVAKHLVNPHLKHKLFEQICRSEEISILLKNFLEFTNANLYCTHSKISIKKKGKRHEWLPHQDSSYQKHNLPSLSVAVLLDDCTIHNGALQIYPRSHRKGKLKHERIISGDNKNQTFLKDFKTKKCIDIIGKSGDFVIFNRDTVHGGGENLVGGIRSIFIFEIEPFKLFAIDTLGNKPIVLKGRLSKFSFFISYIIYNIKSLLKKIYSFVYFLLKKF